MVVLPIVLRSHSLASGWLSTMAHNPSYYLNRKTKSVTTSAYSSALSRVLELKESNYITKEKLTLFRNIQEKWKNGDYDKDWNTYTSEKATSISTMVDDNLERSEKYDQLEDDESEFPIKDDPKDQNPFMAICWNEWLEKILEVSKSLKELFPIDVIQIKILTYQYTPANQFEELMIKYIGKVLMDFINKIIDIPGHVMTIDQIERDWIINKISPLFIYMQATFINKVQFHWIEHDIELTHERLVSVGNTTNKNRMKADIIGVRLSDNRQVVFFEMSGAPTDFLKVHPIEDTYKTIQERIDSLNSVLLNYLNYDVRYAAKIRSLTIQGIRDRLTLRTIFLKGKNNYVDEEEMSAAFPLSWDFRFQFIEVFELMEFVILSILEYPDNIKELIRHSATLSEFSIRNCIKLS
ncbi:hypothetical protein GLOIN_2v1598434 [Rhizophagus clarus]|uniref:Uncharacterized protein n=1 Tax=Rhizophagus clarus TaxID=94130 RepID=A0A8H3M8N8_9GLOM|nr:hypothetical protein GLOIN_2v1598434 [Rhizophagus clarus]